MSIKYVPHDYQKYATEFIIEHPACGLYLDLGLGKTVICLSALWELLLDYFEIGRVLVIAPIRVCTSTWPTEINKFEHLKGLTYSVVVGSEKERRAALQRPAFVYIINRENVAWLVENKLFHFDCVVIDEASSFKNHQSKRFKALRKVRPSLKRIIELTGTPVPNGLLDIWAPVNLLDMGERLGRFIGGFRERYFLLDKRNRDIVFSYKPKEGAEEAIYKQISDICISMKAADHLKMPELIMTNIKVEMSEKEKKLYDQLKKDLILPFADGDIDAQSAVGVSNKLHQMANGAVYDENGSVKVIHSRKLYMLEDMIEAANGKPILVAYWFAHDKSRLLERFPEAVPIDTDESIVKWNKGEIPVGIIQPASVGMGINLQEGGSHLIWYSIPWSLQDFSQTNARIFRQGQKDTVVIQLLVTAGTIDEDIINALEKKDTTQAALLAAVKANL